MFTDAASVLRGALQGPIRYVGPADLDVWIKTKGLQHGADAHPLMHQMAEMVGVGALDFSKITTEAYPLAV